MTDRLVFPLVGRSICHNLSVFFAFKLYILEDMIKYMDNKIILYEPIMTMAFVAPPHESKRAGRGGGQMLSAPLLYPPKELNIRIYYILTQTYIHTKMV